MLDNYHQWWYNDDENERMKDVIIISWIGQEMMTMFGRQTKERSTRGTRGDSMGLTLVEILMKRDKMTLSEAEELVEDARLDLIAALDSDLPIDEAEFMYEWFQLEPDYFLEVLPL